MALGRRGAIAIMAVALLGRSLGAATGMPARAHDLHLSQTRLVVDGTTVAARIRLFEDDLILALTRAAKAPAAVPVTDAAVLAYLRPLVRVRADGVLLTPMLGASGEESDAQNQRVRWYLLTFQAAAPIRSVALRVAPFFELYDDQQNLVTAVRGADGPRRSLLFRTGDDSEQPVRF